MLEDSFAKKGSMEEFSLKNAKICLKMVQARVSLAPFPRNLLSVERCEPNFLPGSTSVPSICLTSPFPAPQAELCIPHRLLTLHAPQARQAAGLHGRRLPVKKGV